MSDKLKAAIEKLRDAGLTLEDTPIRNFHTSRHSKSLLVGHDGAVVIAAHDVLQELDRETQVHTRLLDAVKAREAALREWVDALDAGEPNEDCLALRRKWCGTAIELDAAVKAAEEINA